MTERRTGTRQATGLSAGYIWAVIAVIVPFAVMSAMATNLRSGRRTS